MDVAAKSERTEKEERNVTDWEREREREILCFCVKFLSFLFRSCVRVFVFCVLFERLCVFKR